MYFFCTVYICIYLAPLCRILAYWLMLSVLNTTLNKDYSILFYSVYGTITLHMGVNWSALATQKNHTLYCRSTNIWNIHILQVIHVNQLSCNYCIVCMNLSIIHVTRFNEALVKATYDRWKNIARNWRTYTLLLALHITWPQMARRSVINEFSAVDICNTEFAYFS